MGSRVVEGWGGVIIMVVGLRRIEQNIGDCFEKKVNLHSTSAVGILK